MSDIVDELAAHFHKAIFSRETHSLVCRAAARIEQLEAALRTKLDRRWLAETIDPDAKLDDVEGVTWSRLTLRQRELAYEKADKILAALDQSSPPKAST